MLNAISPIDGRYADKTKELSPYFSEYALIKYRIYIEIHYLLKLSNQISFKGSNLIATNKESILNILSKFDLHEAEKIKKIEITTNHDIKAVEYYLKDKFNEMGLAEVAEWIHFGLTSQDINNTAIPLSIKEYLQNVYIPNIENLSLKIRGMEDSWFNIPLLARTHGQPA
ncbi:MAG: Adenylosuccinate lyase, partial [Bacteroidota bacterium]